LNRVKQLVAFDGHIEVWADGLSFANAFSHPYEQLRSVEGKSRRDRGWNPAIALRYREIRQRFARLRTAHSELGDLYVCCLARGTGELRRYDVSVPDRPKLTSVLQIGGIVRRAAHPKEPNVSLNGGPQMVEISRNGKRVYFTNSLYAAWDDQMYPDGIRTWFVKADAGPDGSMTLDPIFCYLNRASATSGAAGRR
jgi:hypothetical protein